MATKAASSDNLQQKGCAETTKTIVTNVDIGKTLAENSLDQSFWQPIFENQLKITSPNQIKYLGTKDFLSVKGHCRTNWEEKALEALLCGNKNKCEVLALDDWKERERSDQIRMNDRQECVNKTKLNLSKSEDWKTSSKNEDFNKTIDGIIPKSTNQTINVLRQHLDEISVLKNASAGMAVTGILIKHADIENTNKVVIDIVGDICMKAPQKKQCEQFFDFSSKQKHDAYRQSMETFASNGNISVKAANSLDKRILYSYMTDKDEKSTLHVEQFFHSRIIHAFVPVKACELKLKNFIFVPDALNNLKDIEKMYLEKKDFDIFHSLLVKFFKIYGSHVNVGKLHFGGIYEWTAKYESEHTSKENLTIEIVNHVLNAYVSGSKTILNKHVGGTISGDVIKKETNFCGNYDQSELSKVHCGISIYGGPPEAGTFHEWKSRLTSENSTWNIIDRNEFIGIWEILSNHQTGFKDFSRLSKLMEVSYHMEFFFDTTSSDLQLCKFQSVLRTFQDMIRIVCQEIGDMDFINGMMNLKFIQDLFSNIIFFTKTSTDECFVSEVKAAMEIIVKYMDNVDNPVKRSIVSWIGDRNLTQTYTSRILTEENIQDVGGLLSALRDKFLPFINTQRTKRNDKELNEFVKEELTRVCLRLLSSLQATNVFHYALLLSQLQIFNYDIKNYLFPDFHVLDCLVDLTNDLESCIGDYRLYRSQSLNEQAYVVSVIISNMGKYSVSNKEVVFNQCLNPVWPMLHDKIVETLTSCTDSLPYKWSSMRHKIIMLTKEDDFSQYCIPFSDITCQNNMNQTGFDNRLFRLTKSATDVMDNLGLSAYFPNKIDYIDALSLNSQTPEELTVHLLPKMILNDIMMVNRVALDHNLLNYVTRLKLINRQNENDSEESDDEYDDYDNDGEEENNMEDINPLDMLVAIFYCSSYTLQQVLADKLFSCCIAIPFVLPPNEHNDLILLLGTLRAIVVNLKSEYVMYEKTAVDIPCNVLSFIRIGRPHFSKSSMINKFMSSVDCEIFHNHDSPLGRTQRKLSNGLIDLSLFPTQRSDFMFALNLRGDGIVFENSVRVLSEISSVVVVCLEAEHLNNAQSLEKLNVINKCAKRIMLAIDGNNLNGKEIKLLYENYKHTLPSENQNKTSIINIRLQNEQKDLSKIKVNFHKKITKFIKGQTPSNMVERIHNLQFDALYVDEECFDVREKENASLILLDLPNSCNNLKQTIMPLQTTILPEVSACIKKMYSSCNIIALKQNDISQDLLQLREKQLQMMCTMHPFMTTFIGKLLEYDDRLEKVNKFALWMKLYLDERCRNNIQLQENQFKEVFSNEYRLNSRQPDFAFGFEHLMRELAQIFESCFALKSQCEEHTWTLVSKFPAFAAQFLLQGQPVELMDGDTGYVPLEWIKAIYKELGKKLGDKKCMVLSIIGIQSTGKSTLLNTMFGLTFPVCAGRCTKGVFMQIIPVSRNDFQYILVLDTEGLRASTKGNDMNKFDNEIATFAIGLSDINIVNIKGESTSEMKDVMSMAICSLLRLKLGNQNINIHQTCLFVHQNVSAENAYEMTGQERNILTSELDSMTTAAAEHINNYEIKKISDVINFDPHEHVCYIPDLWAGIDKMKYISIGYSVSVSKLKDKIMKLASCDRNYLPFSNLILRVHDIWTGILGDSFVFDFSSSLAVKAYDEMIQQFQELKWNLQRMGENELNQAENLLFATNDKYTEFAENIKSELAKSMKTEQTKHMLTFNEFINNSHLKHLMKHWRLIVTGKLLTEQEKIIGTLQKDYEKLVERVKLKREQSLRQTEYEKEVMKMVKDSSEEERKNKIVLEKKFDEHWALWSKKLIPGLHTPLPSLKELMHRLVNENCDDKMKSYVEEYMSQSVDNIRKNRILVGSLTLQDINISVLNVKQHRFIIKTMKYKETDCKKDALLLINNIFSEIDTYLENSIKSVSQFEERFALMSFSYISKNIDTFQSKTITLSPKFHAMLLSHVAKYLIIYFTRVHTKEEEKHKKFRKQQQQLMYQFMSNITEINNAANYFLEAISEGMEEHVSTKIPGEIADIIVEEFGHSKLAVIKAILLDLADQDRFNLFKMYIDEPRDYANAWTTLYVNRKLFAYHKGTTLTLYSKIAKELLSKVSRALKTGIINASEYCSKSLQSYSSWVDIFTQEMMKAKVFPLKPENIEFIKKHVTDFEAFAGALLDKLDNIMYNIFLKFSETSQNDIEWKECPYTKILDELWGCDEKCPFCSETCIDSNKNHLELGTKHRCWMHRPQGLGDVKSTGRYYLIFKSDFLEVENCSYLIGTSRTYEKPGSTGLTKFCNYRNDFSNWEIKADGNTCPEYWMWVFCEYGHEIEKVNGGVKLPNIPANRKVKKEIAIESLKS